VICNECGAAARDAAAGWRGYLDPRGELLFFCAECSVREFGRLRTRPLDDGTWSPDFIRDYPRPVGDDADDA
jgi:hypothetical protein